MCIITRCNCWPKVQELKTFCFYPCLFKISSSSEIMFSSNAIPTCIQRKQSVKWGTCYYQTQRFAGSYSGIGARKRGLKRSSGPDFSKLIPLLSSEHSNTALPFRGILYLPLQQLLGPRIIVLPPPVTSITVSYYFENIRWFGWLGENGKRGNVAVSIPLLTK